MEKETTIIESIQEVSLEELDQIIGAGKNGVFKTISHECHLNTWAFLATCCSWFWMTKCLICYIKKGGKPLFLYLEILIIKDNRIAYRKIESRSKDL